MYIFPLHPSFFSLSLILTFQALASVCLFWESCVTTFPSCLKPFWGFPWSSGWNLNSLVYCPQSSEALSHLFGLLSFLTSHPSHQPKNLLMECWTWSVLSCVHSSKQLFLSPWMHFLSAMVSYAPFQLIGWRTHPLLGEACSNSPSSLPHCQQWACPFLPLRPHSLGSLSTWSPPCSYFLTCVFYGPMKAWTLEDRHHPWFTSESSTMTIDPGTLGVSNF